MSLFSSRAAAPLRVVLALSVLASAGCLHPNRATLDAYREAKAAGDYAAAGQYLDADARIWFGEKQGEGNALTVKGGPYKDWDAEFRSKSTKSNYTVTDDAISYTSLEINDYYRLLERQTSPARVTYYFGEDGKITGMLYRGLVPYDQRPPDRKPEFERWAAQKYPGLLESDEMEIPRNPRRWRELLTEWRAVSGLAAIG